MELFFRLVRRKFYGTIFNKAAACLFAVKALLVPVVASSIITVLTTSDETTIKNACFRFRVACFLYFPHFFLFTILTMVFRYIMIIYPDKGLINSHGNISPLFGRLYSVR